VDFDRGVITVETLARENPLDSLTNAVVTTLLTPDDPRAVDIFSARTVELGKTPFLYGEVQDHDRKNIRWSWRAERFARHLVDTGLRRRTIEAEGTRRLVRYVTIPMIPDHHTVRASKYRAVVEHFASRFSISKNLVYAIIKTESDFNPFAVSPAPAFGLMQIVPWTAGRDVHRYLNNRDGTPSKEFLFNPENNIRYGTAYLHLLKYRYLETIRNPVSRSYCVIAAYNTGAGNVLRTFHPAGSEAPEKINGLEPLQVYDTLRSRLPTDEARGYLAKVLDAQKQFVRF
jgi:membrane-bound lytic murein transglycosylase C